MKSIIVKGGTKEEPLRRHRISDSVGVVSVGRGLCFHSN